MLRKHEESYRLLRETHHLSITQLSEILSLENVTQSFAKQLSLVSSRGVSKVWITLADESCYGLPYLPVSGKVLDIGSGNGIPGLVWAVLRPNLQFVLADHVNKKAQALESIRRECNLTNVLIYPSDVQTINNQQFDVITARAVAPFPVLWEWTTQCRKVGTRYLLFRGSDELQANRDHPSQIKEIATIPAGRIKLWVGDVDVG